MSYYMERIPQAVDIENHEMITQQSRIIYRDEENIDASNLLYAVGLPIEEIIEPQTTIHHVNAEPYQYQPRIESRSQSQFLYTPQHPNNRHHQPVNLTHQDREQLNTQNKRSTCQRIVTSSLLLFGLIAVTIYLLPS